MLASIMGPDLIIVLLVAVLVLFGSTKIPQLARSLGSAQREFKHGQDHGDLEQAAAPSSVAPPVVASPVVTPPVVAAPVAPVGPAAATPAPRPPTEEPPANGTVPGRERAPEARGE